MLVRACDSKQSIFLWLPFFCCFRQKKVTRRFSGGSFGFDLDVDLLNERNAARPPQRCRGLRRSYPGEGAPLRRLATASVYLRVPRPRLTPLLPRRVRRTGTQSRNKSGSGCLLASIAYPLKSVTPASPSTSSSIRKRP